LYRADVLAEGGDNTLAADSGGWELISLNASPFKGEEPIEPLTLLHNHFGSTGGTATNMTDEQLEAAMDAVREHLKEKLSPNDFEKIEFGEPWVRMPALGSGSATAFLEKLQNGLIAPNGQKPPIGGVPYGTDAGPLAQRGLPCVVFGPGNIAQAHTEDEWIEMSEVVDASERFFHLLAHWEGA
jgi:acetylornithine deacetylase/succinyl-diaminopimelate desuccinylase-like protein